MRPVLVGYDPDTRDRAPVNFGAELARFGDARLIVASVHGAMRPIALSAGQSLPFAIVRADDDLLPDCRSELQEIARDLEARGVQAECRALPGASVARALHEAAEAEQAGTLVVGSSRRTGIGRVLPGGTAQRLLHGAPCPVAVVPRQWIRDEQERRPVGVAFVDTPAGHDALRAGLLLARRAGAPLRVIHVVRVTAGMYTETESYEAGQRAKYFEDVLGEHKLEAIRAMKQALAGVDTGDAAIEVDAPIGDPAETLIGLSEHLRLLVCGSRGYGPARSVLLGGVSGKVVAAARCPVIVLPRGSESSLEAVVGERAAAAAQST
jgi:nucleotide-binding universal stress UspA family protein